MGPILPIVCRGVYSAIEGERFDWHPYAIMIAPPAPSIGEATRCDILSYT